MTNQINQIDLVARAHQEMIDAGFLPDFEPAVLQEVQYTKSIQGNLLGQHRLQYDEDRDLRSLLWSSIDNPESKDLDQIEYIEGLIKMATYA